MSTKRPSSASSEPDLATACCDGTGSRNGDKGIGTSFDISSPNSKPLSNSMASVVQCAGTDHALTPIEHPRAAGGLNQSAYNSPYLSSAMKLPDCVGANPAGRVCMSVPAEPRSLRSRGATYPSAIMVRDWPRLMRDQTAADFLDMSVSAFRQRVKDGRLPQPIRDDGIVRWDRRLLEQIYDGISGLSNLKFEGKDTSWDDL